LNELQKHKEETDNILIAHKEEIEKLRKENSEQKNEMQRAQISTGTCSLLTENYKKIREQNCDLTLELADGKTLEVHKTILMGK
jgi:hypothetical protein